MKEPQNPSKWQWLGWPIIAGAIYIYVIVKEFNHLSAALPTH